MTLVPWNPFSYMNQMGKEMNNMLQNTPFQFGSQEMLPKVDIYQTENQVELKADLPGVAKEDINLYLQDNSIRLSGHFNKNTEIKEENVYRKERHYGTFTRSITLPAEVIADQAKAEYKDGILTVTVPKANPAGMKGKKIDIQ